LFEAKFVVEQLGDKSSSWSRSKEVVDRAEIGEARSIGGAKDCVRERTGGAGEKERNEVEVAGWVIGGLSDEVIDGVESDGGVIDGEVCEVKLTVEKEHVDVRF